VGTPATGSPDQIVTATIIGNANSPKELAAGGEFGIAIKLAIKPGWHIYANPTGVAELNPTKLDVHPQSRDLVTLQNLVYPAGVQKVLASSGKEKVALYEGELEFKAVCVVSSDAKAGSVILKYQLTYQACNDRLCQAPVALEIPLTVRIGSKN
jgi:DsbC/DsbD-like thiol-disulfide interchange protein